MAVLACAAVLNSTSLKDAHREMSRQRSPYRTAHIRREGDSLTRSPVEIRHRRDPPQESEKRQRKCDTKGQQTTHFTNVAQPSPCSTTPSPVLLIKVDAHLGPALGVLEHISAGDCTTDNGESDASVKEHAQTGMIAFATHPRPPASCGP